MKLEQVIILFIVMLMSCSQREKTILIDADGNEYLVRKYGETIWMTENLKTKQDKSGNPVKFYFPNDDSTNVETFGSLYEFETACKICPNGWELPKNEDWEKLFESSGGKVAGIYKDSQYWKDEINSNSSIFSVKPTGYGNNGEYENHFMSRALFWSKSKEDNHFVWTYIFERGKDSIRVASQHPTYAFSVRCIKSIN